MLFFAFWTIDVAFSWPASSRIGRRHPLGDDGGHHLAHDAGVRDVRRPRDLLVRLLEQEERPRELVGEVLVLRSIQLPHFLTIGFSL